MVFFISFHQCENKYEFKLCRAKSSYPELLVVITEEM